MKQGVLYLLFCLANIYVTCGQDYSRGFGSEIAWHASVKSGLENASASNKVMVLLIHKDWCSACKAFKPKFASSAELKEISKNFVMVNTEEDEESKDPLYAPDGGYFPRILFLDPEGKVFNEVFNENGNPTYKYYYSEAEQVVSAMQRVLQIHTSTTKKEL